MTYIKKLVMHGFKSFAPKTEIVFDNGINTIIGPNGSGKSNISDALCFVLGRISAKSIRAAKSKNLLFMGSQYVKPSKEAYVEIVFDNMKKTFALDKDEVVISRSVKYNGQSTYKINDEVKTRADVIEALAQAGIDSHGFNLVLQGQIQSTVKMHPEDRRKIIEEVAGIAIYESRKEKSLHELQKTEERLKEINAILRERTAFLRNLENERSQALKFKELETTIKRCKATLLQKKIQEKERELASIRKSIEDKTLQKDKIKEKADKMQLEIESAQEKITSINKHIQKSTGVEQDSLRNAIANLKAELEGMRVRKENYENRKAEIERRMSEFAKSIPQYELEIKQLRHESPLVTKKRDELRKKKEELASIEDERRKIHSIKAELAACKERIKDKESQLGRNVGESTATLKQLEDYSLNLMHKTEEACKNSLASLKEKILSQKSLLEELNSQELQNARIISSSQTEIASAEKIKSQIQKIDTCPLCQSKMTESHVKHVSKQVVDTVESARMKMQKAEKEIESIKSTRDITRKDLLLLEGKATETERELTHHKIIEEKKEYLKKLVDHEHVLKKEIGQLEAKRTSLEAKTTDSSRLDEQQSSKMLEIEEISAMTEEDVDRSLLFKERDLEKMHEALKVGKKDVIEISQTIAEMSSTLEEKRSMLDEKEKAEHSLNEQFKKLFKEREDWQKAVQEKSFDLSTHQNEWRQVEEQVNYLKIGNAQIAAGKEALDMELTEFAGIELIQGSQQALEERLKKSQETIQTIGSINMRALEIYDEIKAEYERVQEKVTTLDNEKQKIMGIIAEIDNKKKKTFMKTFTGINELFSSNFSKLSTKGQAFLELENPESIFEGGVNIVIRMQRGKYFDVTSLSGGEQTLVALALLFAIQEFKPYHFYVLDEIDAALDKRNSERLSALLKQYMKSGQYITITHNDALIMDSNVLYGVSMHDGVSKVLSLKLD